MYNVVCCVGIPCLLFCAATGARDVSNVVIPGLSHAQTIAGIVSMGPMAVGMVLLLLSSRNATKDLRKTFVYPFHKEARGTYIGSFLQCVPSEVQAAPRNADVAPDVGIGIVEARSCHLASSPWRITERRPRATCWCANSGIGRSELTT